MKLGLILPYGQGAMTQDEMVEFTKVADQLGYHSIWMAEAWSFDAFLVLGSLVEHTKQIALATGIVNVYSRTPSMLAQSAATLDALSSGRVILGVGASGPQVIEGWHGMPYRKPLQRTRETIEIIRTILKRERLNYDGEIFTLDKGLKLINHPVRDEIPIYIASLGPKNIELTAEVANGWMPTLYSPSKAREVFGPALDAGRGKRDPSLSPLEVAPTPFVCITDDPSGPRQFAKFPLALYVGGMGSREQNFYNRLYRRYGYEKEAAEIQDLYLDKQQGEAMAKVTDEMVDEISAIGSLSFIKDRFAEFEESGATMLICTVMGLDQPSRLEMIEQLSALI